MWFTKDGKTFIEARTPTLFWQPIEFEIPKKPKKKEKAWQWICMDKDYHRFWITGNHYADAVSVIDFFPNSEPIEPYLPSEVEREVQE